MIIETLSMIGRNLFWQTTLLATIVFCVLHLLPREQISARYRVALSGLLSAGCLFVLPFLPTMSFGLSFTPDFLQSAHHVMSTATPTTTSTETLPQTFFTTGINPAIILAPISSVQLSISSVLVLTWLTGSCLAFSRLGFAAWQGKALSRRFIPVHLKKSANLSRPVTIVRSTDVCAPLVFGLLKPKIVAPVDFSLNLDTLETRIVLEHEIAHIVRGDLWVNLAQRTVLALLWWCLPLYWINRQVGAERENLCDALATAHIKQSLPNADNPARMLANALVRFAEQKSQMNTVPILAIGIHPHAALLARRVQLLCDSNPVPLRSKKLTLSTSLAAPVTLFMLSTITPRALADSPPPLAGDPVISSPYTADKHTPLPADTVKIVQGRLSSVYGLVRERFDGKMHTGIDIANKLGTPIYAPADGRIVEATDTYKNSTKWGKVVVIETAGGVQTVFAHLNGYFVSTGQTIKAGEQIAQMGNTGKSTGGPHVHLETLIDGQHVDPLTVWPELPTKSARTNK
jgi:murein DD-endopeptidase MepM/ murein hydrolase activator NlpD